MPATEQYMPRIDRIASIYLSHPLARVLGAVSAVRVPILMYHSISENLFGKSHPYYQINCSPDVFAKQMRWLRANGYRTLDLTQMWTAMEAKRDLSKTVVITFDDGYRDFYTDGFDAMRQCGFTATIFLATDRIKDTAVRIDGVDYLTWAEVRELQAGGTCFGSHTVTHPDLRSLGPEQIEYEVGCSKETIEQKLGVPVESFSYPFAFPEENKNFTQFLVGILENQGFENGVSTIICRASKNNNRYYLPRLPVNSWDDADLLRAKLEGGYDWLHWPQWLYKRAHHNRALMQRTSTASSGNWK
jgi:peptidoglycan/xylan/chitin deacetylase (PgdA/CDA1 family)